MDSSVTPTYRHLADKVYKNPGTNVFGLFYPPIYNKVGFAYISVSYTHLTLPTICSV